MTPRQPMLFAPRMTGSVPVSEVQGVLAERHYLGPLTRAAFAWSDEFGVALLSPPTSRRLPHDRWLELSRWCLYGERNGGSRQWSRIRRWLAKHTQATTVVSYSDPSVGHTGALYRACGWRWAPTWHRLRPPPSGNGEWAKGRLQSVKDRWVFCLRDDAERDEILRIKDDAIVRRLAREVTE